MFPGLPSTKRLPTTPSNISLSTLSSRLRAFCQTTTVVSRICGVVGSYREPTRVFNRFASWVSPSWRGCPTSFTTPSPDLVTDYHTQLRRRLYFNIFLQRYVHWRTFGRRHVLVEAFSQMYATVGTWAVKLSQHPPSTLNRVEKPSYASLLRTNGCPRKSRRAWCALQISLLNKHSLVLPTTDGSILYLVTGTRFIGGKLNIYIHHTCTCLGTYGDRKTNNQDM